MSNFAALESAINKAALTVLANATATVGDVTASVIYRRAYTDPLGISSASPRIDCLSTSFATIAAGDAISVSYLGTATSYTVRTIEPDGTGMLAVMLQDAT